MWKQRIEGAVDFNMNYLKPVQYHTKTKPESGAGRLCPTEGGGRRRLLKLPGVSLVSEAFFTVEIDRQGPDKMFRRTLSQNIAVGRMLERGNRWEGWRAGWQRVGSAFGDDLLVMNAKRCGITTLLRFTHPG